MERLQHPSIETREAAMRSRRLEIEEKLQNREVLLNTRHELYGGCNSVLRYGLEGGDFGIFKPVDGEQEELRMEIEAGSYYLRERASYVVDKFLGFNLIPPTVIREIDGRLGSFQQRIMLDQFQPEAFLRPELYKSQKFIDKLFKLFILDYINYETDRNCGNYLIDDKNADIYAIDNSLSFADDPMYVANLKDNWEPRLRGQRPDRELIEETARLIDSFLSSDEQSQLFLRELSDLIGRDQASACLKRMQKISRMLKSGIFADLVFKGVENILPELTFSGT